MMADGEMYSFNCDEHWGHVREAFNILRMNETYVDCTLTSGNDTENRFKAHKLLLSASSDFFRNILQPQDNQHVIVALPTIDSKSLALILEFIYKGNVRIAHSELNDFVNAAKYLKVRGLVERVIMVTAGAAQLVQNPEKEPHFKKPSKTIKLLYAKKRSKPSLKEQNNNSRIQSKETEFIDLCNNGERITVSDTETELFSKQKQVVDLRNSNTMLPLSDPSFRTVADAPVNKSQPKNTTNSQNDSDVIEIPMEDDLDVIEVPMEEDIIEVTSEDDLDTIEVPPKYKRNSRKISGLGDLDDDDYDIYDEYYEIPNEEEENVSLEDDL